MRRNVVLWIIAGVYWAGLFALTHLPRLPDLGPRVGDKIAHFIAYATLAGVLYAAMRPASGRRTSLRVLLICLAYGAVDEWTQALPGINRSCELNDWRADAAGALLVCAAASVLFEHYHPPRAGEGRGEGMSSGRRSDRPHPRPLGGRDLSRRES